jgi:hypothetical protein
VWYQSAFQTLESQPKKIIGLHTKLDDELVNQIILEDVTIWVEFGKTVIKVNQISLCWRGKDKKTLLITDKIRINRNLLFTGFWKLYEDEKWTNICFVNFKSDSWYMMH